MEPKVPEDIYKTHLENKGMHFILHYEFFFVSQHRKFLFLDVAESTGLLSILVYTNKHVILVS